MSDRAPIPRSWAARLRRALGGLLVEWGRSVLPAEGREGAGRAPRRQRPPEPAERRPGRDSDPRPAADPGPGDRPDPFAPARPPEDWLRRLREAAGAGRGRPVHLAAPGRSREAWPEVGEGAADWNPAGGEEHRGSGDARSPGRPSPDAGRRRAGAELAFGVSPTPSTADDRRRGGLSAGRAGAAGNGGVETGDGGAGVRGRGDGGSRSSGAGVGRRSDAARSAFASSGAGSGGDSSRNARWQPGRPSGEGPAAADRDSGAGDLVATSGGGDGGGGRRTSRGGRSAGGSGPVGAPPRRREGRGRRRGDAAGDRNADRAPGPVGGGVPGALRGDGMATAASPSRSGGAPSTGPEHVPFLPGGVPEGVPPGLPDAFPVDHPAGTVGDGGRLGDRRRGGSPWPDLPGETGRRAAAGGRRGTAAGTRDDRSLDAGAGDRRDRLRPPRDTAGPGDDRAPVDPRRHPWPELPPSPFDASAPADGDPWDDDPRDGDAPLLALREAERLRRLDREQRRL